MDACGDVKCWLRSKLLKRTTKSRTDWTMHSICNEQLEDSQHTPSSPIDPFQYIPLDLQKKQRKLAVTTLPLHLTSCSFVFLWTLFHLQVFTTTSAWTNSRVLLHIWFYSRPTNNHSFYPPANRNHCSTDMTVEKGHSVLSQSAEGLLKRPKTAR